MKLIGHNLIQCVKDICKDLVKMEDILEIKVDFNLNDFSFICELYVDNYWSEYKQPNNAAFIAKK